MELELWERFVRERDIRSRDRLFELHAPWAASLASNIHRRVPAYYVDREDFIQNARIGLLEAMSRYDPGRGIAFRAYATRRVRGAVFNGLRAILRDRPPAARSAAWQQRLESIQGDPAEDAPAFDEVVDSIVSMGLSHLLDTSVHASLRGRSLDGYLYARADEVERRVGDAIARLPARLQAVILGHYRDGIQFQELALAQGVTKGRISQLHRAALDKLRLLLQDLA